MSTKFVIYSPDDATYYFYTDFCMGDFEHVDYDHLFHFTDSKKFDTQEIAERMLREIKQSIYWSHANLIVIPFDQ